MYKIRSMAMNNPNLFFEEDIEGENLQRKFLNFLNDYQVENAEDAERTEFYYKVEAANMQRNRRLTMYVDFQHLIVYSETYDLAEMIQMDFYK